MSMGATLTRHGGLTIIAAVALFGLTYQLSPFRDYQLATAAAYLCAASGLTVLTGLNGQVSLGHGALVAAGAYPVALTQNAYGDVSRWVLPASLALGVLTAAAVGLLIGVTAARLRGPYLAGVTLAVAVVVPAVATTWDGVFNGDQGLSVYVDPPPEALGYDFPPERWQSWLALLGALLVMLLLANLTRSRFGRTMRAVRDDEVAAKLAGIEVARVKVLAFVLSAACAGLSGGLLAVLAQSVSPGAFSLTLSLFLLLAVVVGGLGSLAGAVWGALALVLLPNLTTSITDLFTLPPAAAGRLEGNLPLAIFGLTLVVVMIAAPGGIQGLLRRAVLAASLRLRRTARPTPTGSYSGPR